MFSNLSLNSYSPYSLYYNEDVKIESDEIDQSDTNEEIENFEKTIHSLPNDILYFILSFCDLPEINAMIRCGKKFDGIFSHKELWEQVGKKIDSIFEKELNDKQQVREFYNFIRIKTKENFFLDSSFLTRFHYEFCFLNDSFQDELRNLLKIAKIENILLLEKVSDVQNFLKLGSLIKKHFSTISGYTGSLDYIRMTSLKELIKSYEEFIHWCDCNYESLSKIDILDLSLTKWLDPDGGYKFQPTKGFGIHGDTDLCRLTSLPSDIAKLLPKLKYLFLFAHTIDVLPKDIEKKMPDLEDIDLSYNRLSDGELIKLSKLKNLKTISLVSNKLSNIPIEFSKLKNLQQINLTGNGKIKIPEEIKNKKISIKQDDLFDQKRFLFILICFFIFSLIMAVKSKS